MIVRADPGTENVKVEILQKHFRANGLCWGKELYVWKINSKSGKNLSCYDNKY